MRDSDRVRRWVAVAAATALLANVVVISAVEYLTPADHPVRDYLSQLASPGRPYASFFSGWLIAFPMMFAPFVIAVYLHCRDRALAWSTPALLVIFAVAIALCGGFPYAPGADGPTFSNQVHRLAIGVGAVALVPCPLFFRMANRAAEGRRVLSWRRLSVLLVACACVTVQCLVLTDHYGVGGLIERTFFGAYALWSLWVAGKIFRAAAARVF